MEPATLTGDKSQPTFLLFSGSNYRAIVTFCRVLERLQLDYVIVARTGADLIFKTRYRKRVVAVRQKNELDLDDIGICLQKATQQAHYSPLVVCPASEYLNLFLLKHRSFFTSNNCHIPLVSEDAYRFISDKYDFSCWCASQGVAVPSQIPDPALSSFPFVLKPYHNVGKKKQSLYPYLIYSERDLADFYARENSNDFFGQQFIPGPSYYLLLYISPQGKVAAFSQRNILQQSGGKSIVLAFGADFHLHPQSERFIALLRQRDFFGLAMVEFKYWQKQYYFIELNPRMWGPSQLLIDSGSPLIDAFLKDQAGQEIHQEDPPKDPGRGTYLWLNGYVQDRAKKKKLTWYIKEPRFKWLFFLHFLRKDVYFHWDSWRLLISELWQAWFKKGMDS